MSHLDGRFKLEQNRLRDENLPRLGAQIANLRLQKLHLLPWSASPHLEQPVDDGVEIDIRLVRHLCCLPRQRRQLSREAESRWRVKPSLMIVSQIPARSARLRRGLVLALAGYAAGYQAHNREAHKNGTGHGSRVDELTFKRTGCSAPNARLSTSSRGTGRGVLECQGHSLLPPHGEAELEQQVW